MSVITPIMQLEAASWIENQIVELPDRAKYRAYSAVRSLKWANDIYKADMPIPACFCALHATEEAVAAFISCAKVRGYADAKCINITDHAEKATVSLLAQKVSNILQPYKIALALDPNQDVLVSRHIVDGKVYYNEASATLFHFLDDKGDMSPDFYEELVETFGNVDELISAVRLGQKARNEIFYATSTGYPTGFDTPEELLIRECQLSLGLIWGAVDINRNGDQLIPFFSQALQTAKILVGKLKKR
ncbi:hypothetical protein [Pararhodobacter oceanensis]|uniref:hypothetical protein n=1 Tax=Pararhodobacter oceanensis TaxID=2172121 RepID=UPI003A8F1BE5